MGAFSNKALPGRLSGFGAAALSLYFLFEYRAEASIAVASIYFLIACITDTLKTKIPNVLNLVLGCTGLVINGTQSGWSGIVSSLLGLVLGIGLLLLPYAMGGFGAGDVKALGALGALTGPSDLLHIFIYMAFYGGGMAVLHYLFNQNLKMKIHEGWSSVKASALSRDISQLKPDKGEPLRFPYAAAIAFGYYSYITWGGII